MIESKVVEKENLVKMIESMEKTLWNVAVNSKTSEDVAHVVYDNMLQELDFFTNEFKGYLDFYFQKVKELKGWDSNG